MEVAMSLVSVIMPTRDRLDMLKVSVESVVGSFEPIELIVVDSSTDPDSMLKFFRPYTDQVESFHYIYRGHEEDDPPCILPICRNIGLDSATGEYVTFHDSKNRQGKHKLFQASWELDGTKEIDVVFGNAKHPTGDLQNSKSAQEFMGQGLFKKQWEMGSNYIGINSAVWRRSLGIRLDPLSGAADDLDLALTLSRHRIKYIDVDMYYSPGYHPESVSNKFNATDFIPHILNTHHKYYE